MLDQALSRDHSPATVDAALPVLRRIADTTQAPEALGLLADALRSVDVGEAELLLRESLDGAVAQHDPWVASTTAGILVGLLVDTGRWAEALTLLDVKAGHVRAAGLGPWTQLADQGRRLEILARQGRHEQVLTDLQPLLDRMAALPTEPIPGSPKEAVDPWNVREATLSIGRSCGLALGRWEQSLAYNAAIHASQIERGAGEYDLADTWFHDSGPLRELGRLKKAEDRLLACQQIYIDHRDYPGLGRVFSARALLENKQGRPRMAADLVRIALRYNYLRPQPEVIAGSHNNLAAYLEALGDDGDACAHQLTAALLYQLIGYGMRGPLDALADDLHRLGSHTPPPATLAELAEIVEQVDGVHLTDLVNRLCRDPATVDAAITTLLRTATDLGNAAIRQGLIEEWDSRIAELIAAAGSDQHAEDMITPLLDEMAGTEDWAGLAGVWRRILAGERDHDTLTAGLDPIDTMIVTRALDALAGRIHLTFPAPTSDHPDPSPSDQSASQ